GRNASNCGGDTHHHKSAPDCSEHAHGCFPSSRLPKAGAAAFAQFHPPTGVALPMQDHVSRQSVRRLAGEKLVETFVKRYALSARFHFGSRCSVTEGDSPKVVR